MAITTNPPRKRPKTEYVGYKLPPHLIDAVRYEAARRRMWPAQVVAEILDARYGPKAKRRSAQEQS